MADDRREPVPHVVVGQLVLSAGQEAAVEAYRLAHGSPWTGMRPTAQIVNEAIDWRNERAPVEDAP